MFLTLAIICVAVLGLSIVLWTRRQKNRQDVEQHSISAEALHTLLASNKQVLLFDVRRPLDLLAYSEIIPGAKRIPPKDFFDNPSLIPRDKDSIVYCTCPGDETSLTVLHQARALNFFRIKVLKGGLAAWKAKGYPVEPYLETFRLESAT